MGATDHTARLPPASPAVIRKMCDAIGHRGADDEGVHVDGPVGLGMRRLSIIDLAGGHQPIFNEDRSAVIVFNGEIYNYQELRRGLGARGRAVAAPGGAGNHPPPYAGGGARGGAPPRGRVWVSAS